MQNIISQNKTERHLWYTMEKTAKKISSVLCGAITLAAAVISGFYTALPASVSADITQPCASGGFSGAQLREKDGEWGYYVGAIPIKTADITRKERPSLIPCGTPFGIKLRSEGVMVVAVTEGSPAAEGGIKKGDIITRINGEKVHCNDDVTAALTNQSEILLKRGDSELSLTCCPNRDEDTGCLKMGAWVRDSAAGIGTMTFCDPETGTFGGLGHAVSDITTGALVPLASGEITAADIYDIVRGEQGAAGELCGALFPEEITGRLSANTPVGVFGTLSELPQGEAVPVAFRQEVKTGSAYILATLDGKEPKAYSIEIERVNLLGINSSKGMVIRITDPELLAEAGGIVRGMSGSPIIQNGMLVGAVTHVLVNDPERGYAVFAETMLEQMLEQDAS